jgi:uncharacterized protein
MDLFWGEDGRLRSGWRFGLSVFFFVVVNSFAIDLANSWAGPSDRKFELFYRPLLMIFLLVAFSVLLKTLDRVEGNPLPAMGLVAAHVLHDGLLGLIAGTVMVAVAVLPIAIGYRLGLHLVLSRHSLKLACAVLFILATGAMAEEIAFRGYPFQRLVDATGAVAAIGFSSALFGAVHLRNPHASIFSLINTIAIGIVVAVGTALWLESDIRSSFRSAGKWYYAVRSGGARSCHWSGVADRRTIRYRGRSGWNGGHLSRVKLRGFGAEEPS